MYQKKIETQLDKDILLAEFIGWKVSDNQYKDQHGFYNDLEGAFEDPNNQELVLDYILNLMPDSKEFISYRGPSNRLKIVATRQSKYSYDHFSDNDLEALVNFVLWYQSKDIISRLEFKEATYSLDYELWQDPVNGNVYRIPIEIARDFNNPELMLKGLYYIDYLDAKNNHQKTRKCFPTFEEAELWGKENLPNYTWEMIEDIKD